MFSSTPLWYKYWLETRWRWIFSVIVYIVYGFPFLVARANGNVPQSPARFAGNLSILWIITAAIGAGTGIKTQSATLNAVKGLHGSTMFTLSMPVRRSMLFGVRTVVGLALMAVTTVVTTCLMWAVFRSLQADMTLGSAAGYGVAMFVCCLGFYFLSSFLSIYLDAQWQLYGSLLAIGVLWWVTRGVDSDFNVFRTFTVASPIVTRTMPWDAMATSVVLAAIMVVLTLRVVETREF